MQPISYRCHQYPRTSFDSHLALPRSVDLLDAFHSKSILAYGMNGADLPIANRAPLRLRVERHLGYKHAKYIMRIEVGECFARIGLGKGGFWDVVTLKSR
jgi:DMSO/TMAO reductase YedYZ molybdopterin-dependent catalytic subunit